MLSRISFPKIIGHRGACGHAPENTAASLSKAHALGLHAVEFDVRLSSDGEIILFHDSLLERTTNGHGRVFDRTYQSLAELDAGSWFHAAFANQRILRFVDACALIQALKLAVILDIKVDDVEELVITNKLIEVLEKNWPSELDLPLLSSFSVECLSRLKSTTNKYSLVLLLHDYQSDWLTLCKQLNCCALHVYYQVLTEPWIKEIHEAGMSVRCFTVNELHIAKQLFEQGVDGIITDFPDRMVEFL